MKFGNKGSQLLNYVIKGKHLFSDWPARSFLLFTIFIIYDFNLCPWPLLLGMHRCWYASNEDLKLIYLMVIYTEIIDIKSLIYFLDIRQTVTRMLEETG